MKNDKWKKKLNQLFYKAALSWGRSPVSTARAAVTRSTGPPAAPGDPARPAVTAAFRVHGWSGWWGLLFSSGVQRTFQHRDEVSRLVPGLISPCSMTQLHGIYITVLPPDSRRSLKAIMACNILGECLRDTVTHNLKRNNSLPVVYGWGRGTVSLMA